MTLQSLRKHPITRPNTPRPKGSSAASSPGGQAGWEFIPSRTGWKPFLRHLSGQVAGTSGLLAAGARRILAGLAGFAAAGAVSFGLMAGDPLEPSPLERLRERSADSRWREIRGQWMPSEKVPEAESEAEAAVPLFDLWTPVSRRTGDLLLPPLPPPEEPGRDEPGSDGEEHAEWWSLSAQSAERPGSAGKFPSDEDRDSPGSDALTPVSGPAMTRSVPTPDAGEPARERRSLSNLLSTPSPLKNQSRVELLVPPSPSEAVARADFPVPPPAVPQAGDRLPPVPVPPGPDFDPRETVFRPITQIQPYYDYSPTGERPHEYLCPQPADIPEAERARCPELLPLPITGATERHFAHIQFQWLPSNLYHHPLYFEDVPLERYGHTFPFPLQPIVSVAKFGVHLVGLPYQMALNPVWHHHYALGYYRPGDPAPHLHYRVPLNCKAIAAAAGVYTGLVFLIP